MTLYEEALYITERSIAAVLPDAAVRRALEGRDFSGGRLLLIAAGKAAWRMAKTAVEALDGRVDGGVVITKYGHVMGDIPGLICCEGGHPLPDENGFRGTRLAMEAVRRLGAEDHVLFLLSGGGSALFECPLLPEVELVDITSQLLTRGADIVEINTIRKRLSAVKGGRFAQLCGPARVYSVILSDVLGGRADMIASGPCCADPSTCAQALEIAERYGLELSELARRLLETETPKLLENSELAVTGSVGELCLAAEAACSQLGYETMVLTDSLACEAREAGALLAGMARYWSGRGRKLALVAGGETVVHIKGPGLGGRNQELALAAAQGLAGLRGAAVFSFGSDGTDGPTDAAGGFADGGTKARLESSGRTLRQWLDANDSYHALDLSGGLIKTGPTGTNVNDAAVVLIDG